MLTLLPVTYCLVFDREQRRQSRLRNIESGFHKRLEAHEKRIENYNMKNRNNAGSALKIVLPICLLLALGTTAAAQTGPLSLDSCLSLAKQRNCTIKTAQLEIAKAHEVKRQMFMKYFPQVSGTFIAYHALHHVIGIDPSTDESEALINELLKVRDDEGNPTGEVIGDELGLMRRGLSVGVTAVQPIYAGGRIVNANRYAKMGIEAAELKAEATERDVLEEVQSTYLLVQGLQEKVATVEAAMTLLDSLDRVVAVGRKAGVLEPTDALKLELKRNEMRAKQLQLQNGIRLASKLLCIQIGIDYPEGGLELLPVEDITPSASGKSRPEYRLLQLNLRSEEFKKKLTLGESLPTIALGANYAYGDLISNGTLLHLLRDKEANYQGNGLLFVTATIPITGWLETSEKLRQHNIAIRQAQLMQDELTRKLRLQDEKTEAEVLEAEALMRSDSAALRMAEENYRLAELNYRAGMGTMTETLEANALLLQAQNALTDRRITYLAAKRRSGK